MGFDSNALVLEISLQDNFLKMSLFEQREPASTLKHYSQCPVSLAEIEKICQELASLLNKSSKNKSADSDSLRHLEKAGQLLWDHLLTRPVKDRLKSTLIKNLILYIDEELVSVPWELLYDGESFLCLRFNLGRLVITREQSAIPQYRSSPQKLKMLVLANPTGDLESAYHEGVGIKNQFDRKADKLTVDFKSSQISRLYLKKNLRDYDIVHFAGHCEYELSNAEDSGWVLSDGKFTSGDIMLMGETLSLPTLVFSNACHSAQVRSGGIDAEYQQKTYSLASAFLFAGVRHYIGAIRRIEDQSSRLFAQEFYSHLVSGKPVGESIRLARIKLVKEYGIINNYWASYLLYGDPTFALFAAKPKSTTGKLKKDMSVYRRRLLKILFTATLIAAAILMYTFIPWVNPGSYFIYKRSQDLFNLGKNLEVLALASNITKNDPLFLPVYPLLGDAHQRLGRREDALKNYFDYAIYSEKLHNKKHLASAYIGIGWVYQLQGEYPKSYEFYNKAFLIARESKDRLNEAKVMRKMAVWYMDKADNGKALELLTKSSEINRQRQHLREYKYNLACDYFDLGLVFVNTGDYTAARDFYAKSQAIFEKLKLKNELSDCYFNLGETYLLEKQYHKALENYLRGLKIDESQGNKYNIASDYNMIGELYIAMDNLPLAEKYFNQAVTLSKQIDASPELAAAYYNLGTLYRQKGSKNKSREYLRLAQEIYKSTDSSVYEEIKKDLLNFDN